MKAIHSRTSRQARRVLGRPSSRRGAIFVLVAGALIVILAFTAFTVDVGYITKTKAQLQNAADAAVLGAAGELVDGFGVGAALDATALNTKARNGGVSVAAANRNGNVQATYADFSRDIRFGQYQWNAGSGSWTKSWGTTPYNMAEVTLHRDQSGSGTDGKLPLFVAPAIGYKNAGISAKATAALLPGVGFTIKPGSGMKIGVLPITLDLDTWTNLMNGAGSDNFKYNAATNAITSGSDGIKEVNLYPTGSNLLPPGNRGTVDIGSPNNSTNDIKRQILYGLNEFDLSFMPNKQLRYDQPLTLNGDTGLSAGIKAELEAIKGQPRAIPIFTSVSGPGNNAMYSIVKFVGIRILEVQLTGGQKYVTVQPAPFIDPNVIPGNVTLTKESILSPVSLIR